MSFGAFTELRKDAYPFQAHIIGSNGDRFPLGQGRIGLGHCEKFSIRLTRGEDPCGVLVIFNGVAQSVIDFRIKRKSTLSRPHIAPPAHPIWRKSLDYTFFAPDSRIGRSVSLPGDPEASRNFLEVRFAPFRWTLEEALRLDPDVETTENPKGVMGMAARVAFKGYQAGTWNFDKVVSFSSALTHNAERTRRIGIRKDTDAVSVTPPAAVRFSSLRRALGL